MWAQPISANKSLRGQGGGGGGEGPRPNIWFYAFFVEGKQSYQMLITRSKNIHPSLIYCIFKIAKYIQIQLPGLEAARFTRNYLKILNFDTKTYRLLQFLS